MLNTIRSMLVPSKGRQIPIWNKVLYDLNMRTEIYKQRFYQSPVVFSPCVNLLRYMLLNVDINYLITQLNDVDLYVYELMPKVELFRKAFDTMYTGREDIKCFVQDTGKPVPEFILNTHMTSPMMSLPFGKSWEQWKYTHPVHILHHDADELISNLFLYTLTFKGQLPSRVIVSIDIAQYLMKFVKYAQYMTANKEEINVDKFIQHHIVSQWYDDLIRIWCMNIVSRVVSAEDEIELRLVGATITDPVIVSAALPNGIANINSEVIRLKQQGNTLEEFMATKWINGKDYFEIIDFFLNDIRLPDQRQYAYLQFMLEEPIVKTVISLARCRAYNGLIPRMRMLLMRKLENMERSNIVNNIRTNQLRLQVKKEITDMWTMLEALESGNIPSL